MITRLKKHNDSLFLILLLLLLSSGTWFFNHSMSGKILFLENEVVKIEKQDLSFIKQNNDLLNAKKEIQTNIDGFLKLQTSVQENKTEDIKKELSQNPKSSELLAILPPSEIANIQQGDSRKKIMEDITSLKDKSATLWQSISKIGQEEFSDTQFALGNISDSSLKTSVYNNVSGLLKKEKELFNSITSYDNSFENFKVATEKLEQVYPLLKTEQNKNKELIKNKVNSMNSELYIIQIVSLVGILGLIGVLVFITMKKKRKSSMQNETEHSEITEYEKTISSNEDLSEITDPQQSELYDTVISFIANLNTKLHKNINLHLDIESFESLTLEQQEKVKEIIFQLVKFSAAYSFETNASGDIIVSLRGTEENYTLLCKDNGRGLFVEEIKEKIKSQYHVQDSVFVGKSDQQIYSFIFKPGFDLTSIPENTDIEPLELNIVSQLVKEINANISLSTEEQHGIEFLIHFQSI